MPSSSQFSCRGVSVITLSSCNRGQALLLQAEPATLLVEDLDAGTAPVAEHEQLFREGIVPQSLLD